MQWYNWFRVLLYSLNFITDFVTWIVTFYQLMLVVTGVMHEADNAYSIRSTWLCYPLVRFPITAYICDNYYRFCRTLLIYWISCFHFTSFLAGVESGGQCLLNSKVLSCFSGVIMSIRSFFLFLSCSVVESLPPLSMMNVRSR